jgi:hypothetical protein
MIAKYEATAVTVAPSDGNSLALDVIVKGGIRLMIRMPDSQLHGLAKLIEATLQQRQCKIIDRQDQSKG